MAAYAPILSGQRATTVGPTNCPGASINAKGAWTELHSSVPFDCLGFYVSFGRGGTTTVRATLMDVGFGGGGSEIAVVSNIPSFFAPNHANGVFVPLRVPKGTRVTCRSQANIAGTPSFVVSLTFMAAAHPNEGFAVSATFGADTTTSLGTSIDPGGTAGQKGVYSQLTASSTHAIKHLIVGFNWFNATPTANDCRVDIAIGAAASEQIILPDLQLYKSSTGGVMGPNFHSFPVSIPVGTRIAARGISSINTSGQRQFNILVIGFK